MYKDNIIEDIGGRAYVSSLTTGSLISDDITIDAELYVSKLEVKDQFIVDAKAIFNDDVSIDANALSLGGRNVYTQLDDLEDKTIDISYNTGTLTTSFANNVKIDGNFQVLGTQTIIDSQTTISDKIEITNEFDEPALYVRQNGAYDIMRVYDDDNLAFEVRDGGKVYCNYDLSVGAISSVEDTLTHLIEQNDTHNGFSDYTEVSLSFDNGTRTLSLNATVDTYTYYSQGIKYQKSSDSKVISTTRGLHYVYYNGDTLTDTTTWSDDIIDYMALVAFIYWDSTNNLAIYIGHEYRHGISMSSGTHKYLHNTIGAVLESGGGLGDIIADGNGSSNNQIQFSNDSTIIWDEDAKFSHSARLSTANIPKYYRFGSDSSNIWFSVTNTSYCVLSPANDRCYYNRLNGSDWELTQVANTKYTLSHVIITNDIDRPYVIVIGQNQYDSLKLSQAGANEEVNSLILGGMPIVEAKFVGTIIVQTNNSYSNTAKSRIVSTDDGSDYVDLRGETITRGGVSILVQDHDLLGGLKLANTGVEYGHINDDTQTIFGEKTFKSDIIIDKATTQPTILDDAPSLYLFNRLASGLGAQGYCGMIAFGTTDDNGGDQTNYKSSYITSYQDDITTSSSPADLEFYTCPSGTMTAIKNMVINSDGSIQLPNSGQKLYFVDTGEYISGNGTDLTIGSGNDINLTANNDIKLNTDTGNILTIYGDSTTTSIRSNNRVALIADDGANIQLSSEVFLTGSTTIRDISNVNRMTIDSSGVGVSQSGYKLYFVDTGEYISGDGTNLAIGSVGDINLTATGDINTTSDIIIDKTGGSEDAILHLKSKGNATLWLEADTDNITETDQPLLKMTQDGGVVEAVLGFVNNSNAFEINHKYADSLILKTSNTTRMTIDNSGITTLNQGKIQFIDSGEYISGNGTDLTIGSGADINLTPTINVNIPSSKKLTFGDDNDYIYSDGTDIEIKSTNDVKIVGANDISLTSVGDIELIGVDSVILNSDGANRLIVDGLKTNVVNDLYVNNGTIKLTSVDTSTDKYETTKDNLIITSAETIFMNKNTDFSESIYLDSKKAISNDTTTLVLNEDDDFTSGMKVYGDTEITSDLTVGGVITRNLYNTGEVVCIRTKTFSSFDESYTDKRESIEECFEFTYTPVLETSTIIIEVDGCYTFTDVSDSASILSDTAHWTSYIQYSDASASYQSVEKAFYHEVDNRAGQSLLPLRVLIGNTEGDTHTISLSFIYHSGLLDLNIPSNNEGAYQYISYKITEVAGSISL